jgi:adenine-specific DNA-methyltransferase
VAEQGYQRYVGARIGIHSPGGVRVGEVSHTENVEYLYVVDVEGSPTSAPSTRA